MAAKIDPRKLRPADLLRLVNSAMRGSVLTEFQLRRHRNQAGYTIGDARTVDLFRYAAWLTLEYFKPKAEPLTYEEQKARQAERNAEAVRAAQDIGEIPAVVDPQRKARCEASFREFCETYFPEVFYFPWSDDHLRVIEKIEKAVRTGGLFAMAMPRGSGKTVLCQTAVLWSALIGATPFVCLIAASAERARDLLENIKIWLENGQVVAEGLVSRDTSWARDVAKSAVNGFPWQASIGAAVVDAEFVPNGQSITVNGRTFTGPLHVVRQAILKEISFVDSGADPATSARIAAQNKEQAVMEDKNTAAQADTQQDAGQNDGNTTATDTGSADTPPTTDPAQEPTTPTSPKPQAATPATVNASAANDDPVTDMRRRMAAETRRVEAIRKVCAGKHPDLEAKAIEEGWDESRTELHVLRASRPQVPAVSSRPRNTSPQVFEAVALMASGLPNSRIEASYAEPVLEAADKLRGVGIQEFCELACGAQLPRFRRDASGWLQAAFSTTSLPGILSNIANKMLLEGYNYVEDAWRNISKIASVNDFKEHTRYRMTGSFQFQQVGPDGELKHGQLGEQSFRQKADTHGIMFALTRQMIINDDMGAFTDIPRQIGMGAAEAIADAVWGLWLANPVQPDGKAFFHADHKNYLAGADTALTVEGLTDAEVAFGKQVKPNGKPLGIRASKLLVPTALKVPAEMLMKSVQLNETTTANKGKPNTNPHVGKFDVVSSVYLSNPTFPNASDKAWYLLADPNRLPAIEVAFLNGVDRPTVEKTDADFNTLGVMFRGYIDFGVKEQDHRGGLMMKGEA